MDVVKIADGIRFVLANRHGVETTCYWQDGRLHVVGGLGNGRTSYTKTDVIKSQLSGCCGLYAYDFRFVRMA